MKKRIFILGIITVLSGSYPLTAQSLTGIYRISDESVNPKEVSPLVYGNFIELGFGRQIEGMWSEKLFNASFEEITPYKAPMWSYLRRTPDEDLTQRPWWHSGYEENQWYTVNAEEEILPITYRKYDGFYHGLRAVLLNNSANKSRLYLAQDRIWINRGIGLKFRGYMVNNRTAKPVKVTIGLYENKDLKKPVAESIIIIDGGIYREYTAELKPVNFRGYATFAVSVEPGANASCDGFSLMPADNIEGFRKDVIEAAKKIHVPMIRYPGGCFASFYNWRQGIGPRADRIPVNSEFWGGLEENNIGTAEFIKLCRILGSEPFICVNMMTGSAADAADWISYCNSVAGDRMHILRKSHGYPEPFRVKYWELDNETYRRWGYKEYAERCVEFSKAMKAADPSVQLVMVGYSSFNPYLKEMLEIAGRHIDLITDRAGTETILGKDLEIIGEYNRKNGTSIRLCNTEWWPVIPKERIIVSPLDPPRISDHMTKIQWNYAMNVASRLLLWQRLGGDFEFANFNNFCNTWGQNIIESLKDTVIISATGKIFELMSRSRTAWVLKTDTISAAKGVIVQSTTPADKKSLIFYVLNYGKNPSKVTFDISAFKPTAKEAYIRTVSCDDPLGGNAVSRKTKVVSSEQSVKLNNLRKPTFPVMPGSVNEITIRL